MERRRGTAGLRRTWLRTGESRCRLSRGGIEGTAGCSQASLWRAHVCEVDVFAAEIVDNAGDDDCDFELGALCQDL
jgi:hypothetical protein